MNTYDKYWGYIPLSEEQIEAIWNSGTIVLDTNILLNFYRYSLSSTDEFINILESYSERIVVPNIVLDEFFNNRTALITDRVQGNLDLKKSLGSVSNYLDNEIWAKYKRSGIEELDYKQLKADVMRLVDNFSLNHTKKNLITEEYFNKNDDILNKIIHLVGEKLIEDYRNGMSDEDLKKEQKIGEYRFSKKIPPGFGDNKVKDGDTKYNDFYVWQSIIKYAKEKDTNIIYITDDSSKKDWFHTFNGKTTGPLKELLNEFYTETQGKMIYIYTSSQFIALHNRNNPDKVSSSDLLEEIETVEDLSSYNYIEKITRIGVKYSNHLKMFDDTKDVYEAIILLSKRFDNIVVAEQLDMHGMEMLQYVLNKLKELEKEIIISEEILFGDITALEVYAEILNSDTDIQDLLIRLSSLRNDFKMLENDVQKKYEKLHYIWE